MSRTPLGVGSGGGSGDTSVTGARLWAFSAAICALLPAACGPGAKPAAHASPSPSARATSVPIDSVPAAQAEAWRALGVSVIPPRGYAQDVHLTQEVLNHTGGRVDDATARRWAEDYLRAGLWEKWGTETLQVDGFFNHLGPGDSVTQQSVFGDNFGVMNKAEAVNGKARVVKLTVTRLTLVVVPDDVKRSLVNTYGYPAPVPDFAWVIDQQGPAGAWVVYPDGHEEASLQLPPSDRDRGVVVGTVDMYPGTLGDIWSIHTYLSCASNAFLRAMCAR
jgi:hypothetical protein